MTRVVVALVVGLLMIGVLAGCLGSKEPDIDPDPTPANPDIALHELDEIVPLEALTPDGTALRGHVYLPNGTGPFATILNYSPYWNSFSGPSDQMTDHDGDRHTMIETYAPFLDAGFAVALVNIRGTGLSEGCKAWFDASIDGPDVNAVIDEIIAQPWSDGAVGMAGISWPGYTQYAALWDPHPALRAVAPSSAVIDSWSLLTRQGAFVMSQFGPSVTTYGAFMAITAIGLNGNVDPTNVQCPQYVEIANEWNQLTLTGDKTSYWQGLDNREIIRDAKVPMWVTNGLVVMGEGHITQVEGLWDLMGDHGRLLLGQFSHQFPTGERGEKWWDELVLWFHHHLRHGPELVETGVVEYEDKASGAWYQTDQWPPAGNLTRLHLSDGNLVADAAQVQESTQLFQGVNQNALPHNCPGVQALWVSPPLANDVRLAGNFLVNLTVTSTLPQGNFGAFVYAVDDVQPCPVLPSDDDEVFTPADWVSQAVTTLAHRGHLDIGEPFPTDRPAQMHMTSHPFAHSIEAGQRIVLAVGGGALEVMPRLEQPMLGVQTGTDILAEVLLPVVEGELVFAEEDNNDSFLRL